MPPGSWWWWGVYRYVRNPMIIGVLIALLGESSLFRSMTLFTYAVIFLIISHIYIFFSEEPGLVKRFGDDYLAYKRHAPRWIPRLTPWHPAEKRD